MTQKNWILIIIAVILTLFCFTMARANVQDTIIMNSPEYSEHSKGLVTFTHNKHVQEYKVACGDCHHDDHGKALSEGDDISRCVVCHTETGKKPKGEKLSKSEKIMKYQKEALHANCKGCHKTWNKENKTKDAPTTCKDCHPKKDK